MIDLSSIKGIYLYVGITDMRAGLKGLSVKVGSNFKEEELIGNLFIFCGRNKKSIKAIEFTEDGIWLYQKRLDPDTFKWPKNIEGTNIVIEEKQLRRLLDGLSIVVKSNNSEEYKTIRY